MRGVSPMFRPDDGSGSAPAGDTPLIGETTTPDSSSAGASFDGLGGLDDDFDNAVDVVEVKGVEAQSLGDSPSVTGASKTPVASAPPISQSQTTQGQPPATPQAPQAQAASPAPVQQVAATASPAPQDGGASGQPPASIPADPGKMLEMLEQNAKEVINNLAASPQFALDEDEALLLETNPAQVVPKILARTYYQAVNATLAHINNLVPGMIDRHMKLVKMQQENEESFYGRFPAIKRDVHGADVARFAQIIKAQNPQMSKDDFFAMVGAAVMAKHGLMSAPVASAANGQAAPIVPATPPFAPASPGATVRTTPIEENPFAGLGQEWDN